MSENVKNFVDKLQTGDNAGAGEAFKDALRDKVGDQLDIARQQLAANMFTGVEAQTYSDPKPVVADPSHDPYKMVGTDGVDIPAAADTPVAPEPVAVEPVAEPVVANEPESQ